MKIFLLPIKILHLNYQKLELLEFAHKRAFKIDSFIEITISSRKTSKQRRIDELLQTLDDADTLIVTELSRLGRSTAEIIALFEHLVKRSIRVIVIKQNLDISQHDMNSKIIITLTFCSWFESSVLCAKLYYALVSLNKGHLVNVCLAHLKI